MRVLLFFLVALAIFLPFNWLSYRQLVRLHPRRRILIRAAIVVGNLMWLFLPFLRVRNGFMRVIRATFGPPWFAWLMFAILYSSVIVLALIAWLPFRRRLTFERFARGPSRLFLIILIAGSAAGCYQALVPLRVERVPVAIPGLPSTASNLKIAVVADLHVGLFTRPARLKQIFSQVNAIRPDLVVFLGDSVDDDPHFIPKLLRGLDPLDKSIPLVAVLGNHEFYGDVRTFIARLQHTRLRLLVNEGIALRGIWFAGLSDRAALSEEPWLKPDADAALRGAGTMPRVVLAHQPSVFPDARSRGVPLTLAAHTHGGQLGVRPLRWSLAGLFLRYHMGYYRLGNSQLYVNTGTGHWLVPFRLGMTPEITLVELEKEH